MVIYLLPIEASNSARLTATNKMKKTKSKGGRPLELGRGAKALPCVRVPLAMHRAVTKMAKGSSLSAVIRAALSAAIKKQERSNPTR
jgi:hypothetical protein